MCASRVPITRAVKTNVDVTRSRRGVAGCELGAQYRDANKVEAMGTRGQAATKGIAATSAIYTSK